jgi:aminoglycoside phosphotransferase
VENLELELLAQLSQAVSANLGHQIELEIVDRTFTGKSEIWRMQATTSLTGEVAPEVFYAELNPKDLEAEIKVWIWPDDPFLPHLKLIWLRESLEVLLDKFEIDFEIDSVKVISYRPTKRAVFRLDSKSETIWAKVVPEKDVQRIAMLEEKLRTHQLSTPRLLNWSKSGILIYESAAGVSASKLTGEKAISAVSNGLRSFLFEIQKIDIATPAKVFPSSRLDRYVEIVNRFSPLIAELMKPERDYVEVQLVEHAGSRKIMNIHGDLHLDQIFYDDAQRHCTFIDLDNMGMGDIHAELGNLLSALWFAELLSDSPLLARWRAEITDICGEFVVSEALFNAETLGGFLARLSTLSASNLPSVDKVADLINRLR